MKKIIIVGKMNEPMREMHEVLAKYFQVQLCAENTETFIGMLKIFLPDLVIINLIGLYDYNSAIFRKLSVEHHEIPVITIGTESEQEKFLKYYEDEQFENLIRPVDAEKVYEACCRRLDFDPEHAESDKDYDENAEGKKLILVVDDNPGTLRTIMGMLKDDYEVMLATSGMQAMTSIGKKCPDLILLDYEMPVCDGRQTLEMIRADREIKDIPVIFLTSVNDREHINAVLTLKPSGYLLKPAKKDKLMETIKKVL